MLTAYVVLAGGASRRFGSDKLAYEIDGRPLLAHTMAGLPDEAVIIMVGPERPTDRSVIMVREDPPGGGPTAGLVCGLAAALDAGADLIGVLPADAPGSAVAAGLLLDQLQLVSAAGAMIGVDGGGREQPLQLALGRLAAEQLVEAAGPNRGAGQSARALVNTLHPPAIRVPLEPAATFDIDDHDQLAVWLRTRHEE